MHIEKGGIERERAKKDGEAKVCEGSESRRERRAGVTLQQQTQQTKESHKQTINKLQIMDTSK